MRVARRGRPYCCGTAVRYRRALRSRPCRGPGDRVQPDRHPRTRSAVMAEVKLAAEVRTEFGKGAARRVRRDNKVPARRLRSRRRAGPRDAAGPRAAARAAYPERPDRPGHRRQDRSWSSRRPCSVTRIKGFLEHVDLLTVKRGEKVNVEIAVARRGRAGPGRQPAGARAEHAAGRGRGHPHPGVGHRLRRGPGGRCLHPRQGHHAARRAPSLAVDEDAVVLQVLAAQAEEPAARGRGRGREAAEA